MCLYLLCTHSYHHTLLLSRQSVMIRVADPCFIHSVTCTFWLAFSRPRFQQVRIFFSSFFSVDIRLVCKGAGAEKSSTVSARPNIDFYRVLFITKLHADWLINMTWLSQETRTRPTLHEQCASRRNRQGGFAARKVNPGELTNW